MEALEGQTLDTVTVDCVRSLPSNGLDCSTTFAIDEVERNSSIIEESDVSTDARDMASDHKQTLPIFTKLEDLSNKVLRLKEEHTTISDEVKGIALNAFPGSELLNALHGLSGEHKLLKRKYLEEWSERKRLYNELIEVKGNIRVFCRCRPLNQDEITKGFTSVVNFDSSQEDELQIIGSDSAKKQFKFDHVFRPENSQEVVFVQTLPIVTSVLNGYNVCVFAYGQTGTGKTFTMEGTPENRGVNYKTLEELFRVSNERSKIMTYEFSVSMLEVYNEKIRDLLVPNSDQPTKKLEIKQSAEGNQEVPGLVEARAFATNDVWELLKSGSRVRSVGSTNANELSSRSHCLVRITVMGENLLNGQKTRSHLWLVDLAGSERVGKIEVEGERLKESQFINKSLSALGDVISALASKTSHIPYRNSKLTHILQSSLGGDCKTLMFVQISPSSADLGETMCSLNFASRVRGIEHGPARKQTDMTELFKYKQMAEKANHGEKENKKLQDNLQSVQLRLTAREQICRSLQVKVRDLENQLAEERKARQKQENRALAAVSSFHSLKQASSTSTAASTITDNKRPPLAPPKSRLPLRRISNFLPQSSLDTPKKAITSALKILKEDKENLSETNGATRENVTRFKPRRGSIAVRPPPPINQTIQPKRRSSIATIRPESSSVSMRSPINELAAARTRKGRMTGRHSSLWDQETVWRALRANSPVGQRSRSTKFMGSPPQADSLKPKNNPMVVALQRKPVVWSPLKLRNMKASRKTFCP